MELYWWNGVDKTIFVELYQLIYVVGGTVLVNDVG